MSQKKTEILTAEEQEVVDFLVELIPVLMEIKIDLEKKNLLDRDIFPPKKNS
jgi:hypothetical protein